MSTFEFKKLNERYCSDAPFNKMTNLFRQLLEQHGFLPSEIREAMFLAQYNYEMGRVEQIIRTKEEWERLAEVRKLMQETVLGVELSTLEPKKGGD